MKKSDILAFAEEFLQAQGVRPLFISISGAHLYGFPSKDSDIDIRCCHVVPTKKLFSLHPPRETLEYTAEHKGVTMDVVSHEVQKVLGLLAKNNSNILENVFAENLFPTREHEQLRQLAKEALSKLVYHPYKGMALQNYKKFIASLNPAYKNKAVKKYLYVMRSYMTGAHALRKEEIEPNIVKLNKYVKLPIIDKLVKLKKEGEAVTTTSTAAEEAIAHLAAELELALEESALPELPQNMHEFDQFLLRVRLKNL